MLNGNGVGTQYAQDVVQRVMQRRPIDQDDTVAHKLIDMDILSQAVLEAEGDINLVAERLLGSKHRADELLSALSADGPAFSAFSIKARAFVLLKLIQTFSVFHKSVTANAHELEPKEAAKLLMKTAEMVTNITKSDTVVQNNTQVNVFENMVKTAPPAVRDILIRMAQNAEELPALADGSPIATDED